MRSAFGGAFGNERLLRADDFADLAREEAGKVDRVGGQITMRAAAGGLLA